MTTPDCCPFCGRLIPNPGALARHAASCSENRNRRAAWRERHVATCPQRPDRPRVPLGQPPCPHCGRPFTRPGPRTLHIRGCSENPASPTFGRPRRPPHDHGVPCRFCGRNEFASEAGRLNHVRYCDQNPDSPWFGRAPAPPTVRLEPCAFCGRDAFVSERARWSHIGKCPQNPRRLEPVPPKTPPETGPCPHCARVTFKNSHSRSMHVARCPENPARLVPSSAGGRPKSKPAPPPPITRDTPCPFCGKAGWASTHSRGQHVRACRDKHREPTDATPAPAGAPAPTLLPLRLRPCPRCGQTFVHTSRREHHVATCGRDGARDWDAVAPLPGGYRCPRCGGVAFAAATHGNHCQKCERDDREAREPGRWRKTIW